MRELKTICFDEQVRMLTEVAQLADQSDAYCSALQAAGYKSFLAWDEFERSFCEPGELKEHKRCQIENMKKRIVSPDRILLRQSDRESEIETSPCLRRRASMEVKDRPKVEKRRSDMHVKCMTYRADELARHIDPEVAFAVEDYASYFSSTLD